MKVYNVNVYSECFLTPYTIEHVSLVDKIIVKKSIFGLREIITGKKINIIDSMEYSLITNYSDLKKYGCALGVQRKDLVNKNLATMDELNNYLNKFENSDIKKKFDKMKVLPKEEFKKVMEKVKRLAKTN